MAAATAAALVAAAAATAVAASTVSAAESCDCCGPLASRRRRGRKRDAESDRLPTINADAPVVKCLLKGARPFGGPCRIAVVKDMLLIGRAPGEAEDSVLLTGAQVSVKGTTVLVTPRLSPPLTLYFSSVADAERWAAKLREASQLAERAQAQVQDVRSADDSQRVQSARIAELEARVSATLHAAVDRSKRIKELEATVEEGKDRDRRIKELEEAVEETMQEASVRGERIKELEAVLASRGGVPDAAASAVLEDAMRFAEQMLENRQEELAIDGEGAQGLQEAVEAVQRAKPAVDGDVAELVSKLVTALRWPLVLRRRLLNAEATVKQQKEIQDNTLRELHDLQQRHALNESEKRHVEAEVLSLSRQLAIAEKTAEEAVGRLEEIHNATGGEYLTLRNQQPLEEAKRVEAEALSRDLKHRLAAAEQAAEESAEQQKALLDAAHQRELKTLQQRHDSTELQRHEAEAHATELREMLVVAERNADEAVARQKEVLEKAHADDLRAFQQLCAAADAQRDDAEERATELRKQLVMTEQAIDAAAARQKELLDQEHQDELTKLQQQHSLAKSQRDHAEMQANELKQRLEATEEVTQQRAEQAVQQCAAVDAKRERAELQAIALKQRLVDAEQAFDKSMKSHRALSDTTHVQEMDELQHHHTLAMTQRDLAELRAEELSEELMAARDLADKQVAQQREALDAARADEVRSVRLQHAKAEVVMGEVEMRASELRERLSAAEAALQDKASRQRDFLDAERTKALTEPQSEHPWPSRGNTTGGGLATGGGPVTGGGTAVGSGPTEAPADGADLLDEIKREKLRIVELESRLASSMAKSSWSSASKAADGQERSAPRQKVEETVKDLDRQIVHAERTVDAAAPATRVSAPVGPQGLSSRSTTPVPAFTPPSSAPPYASGSSAAAPAGSRSLPKATAAKSQPDRISSAPQMVVGRRVPPTLGKAAPTGQGTSR